MVTRRKTPRKQKSVSQVELAPSSNGTEPARSFSPEAELALIQKALKHPTKEIESSHWLDTGNEELNAVFGSPTRGLPCGKLYEVSGFESHGKTAIVYEIAGMAQKIGARVGVWDLETAWDAEWAMKRGLKADEVIVFKPVIGQFGSEKEKRLITAEEHTKQIEMWLKRRFKENPEGTTFLLVDSIAAMQTMDNLEAGVDQNMRTKVSVPAYLSWLLPRWQDFAANYNTWIFFINQVRVKPGIAFGNPEYTPGGNAIRFATAVRVKIRRKGGKILKNGKAVGFKGIIHNWKNKAGGGSYEGAKVGFKLLYDGRSKFVPESEIKSADE